jgi:hypothetical protein
MYLKFCISEISETALFIFISIFFLNPLSILAFLIAKKDKVYSDKSLFKINNGISFNKEIQ